ncbi:hypothetical protein CLU79DRAFT_508364 [Phycomyces nitens]|nr:hypothetical protein CLU79DRAFT_508364 [Phycomyces nitens]
MYFIAIFNILLFLADFRVFLIQCLISSWISLAWIDLYAYVWCLNNRTIFLFGGASQLFSLPSIIFFASVFRRPSSSCRSDTLAVRPMSILCCISIVFPMSIGASGPSLLRSSITASIFLIVWPYSCARS